ncbi:MAG: ABC transporter substrate-binding protein [Sideroxydans sp.]|nr:ABC transporter substrate-binding protein [Sideroxydans sp.]
MPTTINRCVALAALLVLVWLSPVRADMLPGQHIYRDGMLPSGQPLRGQLRNGALLSGPTAACARCHRRSGLGGGEGPNTVRPITGDLLFTPPAATDASRPAYDLDTLARALREGVDPNGRRLDALMPRFELSDAQIGQLAAYLQQLSSTSTPGVSGSEIHFATVIAPNVDARQEQALLSVLQAFFAGKNGATRQEQRRREIGRRQNGGNVTGNEKMYLSYRTWQLHEWRLKGPPAAWPAQLDKYYREQPVFALLSGIGNGDWQPVHAFCERNEIPCLFPSIDFSGQALDGYASFYFSRGAQLEAEVLAKHLVAAGQSGDIVQVFRDDAGGRAAAQSLRSALQQRGLAVADRPLAAGGDLSAAFWSRLLDAAHPQTLVLWLNEADMAAFPLQQKAPPGLARLYVSASLVQPEHLQPADGWLDKLHIVDQSEPATRRSPRMARMKVWLRMRNVPLLDERIQSNAFFAASLAGDALAHMDENYSRDYFIERVEHMTEQSLLPSVYPRLSLGPGQRFASKGAYVSGYAANGTLATAQPQDWLVP